MAASTPRSSDPLTPGLRIGPYLLLAPLGTGGSSRVWAVTRTGQLGFSKRMALKVMRQDKLTSERARERFDREARLGAQLRHANLRAVHELGSHEGRPHMALSWVDTSLEELLEHASSKRLEPEVVCWFGIQVCAALAAAHAHVDHTGEPCPVVHGDVSPGNILLTLNGHVLLADLAASADPSPSASGEQRSRSFFGSLGYAAPEALKGSAVDGRADLFSLGCVLYEALCGAPAFEADDERSLLFQVLERGPVELATRAPDVPGDLARVVGRALQRAPGDRPASAEEMRHALCGCVPALSSFALERRSAELIARVLGERIRRREEEMQRVFQRFGPSQLERTDTLPIGNASQRRDSTTLRASNPDAAAATRREGRGAGRVAPAQPRQGRTVQWLALAALALGASAYVAWPRTRADHAARSSEQAVSRPPMDPRQLSREQQGLQPKPTDSPPAPAPPPAVPGESTLAPSTPAATASASAGSRTSTDVKAPATPSTSAQPARPTPRATSSAPAARAAPQQAPPPTVKPLTDFHPPPNPYEQDEPKATTVKSVPTP